MNRDVALLEELLARVQRNAALPRGAPAAQQAAAAAPPPASAPQTSAPQLEPPSAPRSAPAYDPAPLDSSPIFESSPPFEAAPLYEPNFESSPVAAVAAAPLDHSVDDLLLADPFPSSSIPPAQQSLTDMLDDDEPIPLVSVTSPRSIASEDISAVMSRSDLSHEVPEELLEDDIVEVSPTAEAEAIVPSNHDLGDLDFDDEEQDRELVGEPPASSSRHKVPSSMDEALARAAAEVEIEEGREVPLKTPPPESGPQAAAALPAGIHAPLAPDIEELLEADILPVGGVSANLPTAEQLGQTIDLEEARGPHLELESALSAAPASALAQDERPNDELEVALPQREVGGGYQENLMPPPEALQDLEAHRQRSTEEAPAPQDAPPPESLAQYPSPRPDEPASGFAPVILPASVTTDSPSESVSTVTVDAPPNTEFAPELLLRPELNPSPVAKFIRVEPPRPNTFLELLDASLSLGRN